MYYLAGIKIKLSLFSSDPLKKLIISILFLAIITEFFQLWVPDRAFNVFDMISNVAGVMFGVIIIKLTQRHDILKQNNKQP